jgi:2-methylfumaryl-CoA hydratase
VHIRTVGLNQKQLPVIDFERKALIPAGRLEGRRHQDSNQSQLDHPPAVEFGSLVLPPELAGSVQVPQRPGGFHGLFEDFEVDEILLHANGRTIGESEHMQLTMLSRNSHPLHFDEVYAKEKSLAGTRLVCGPLVFAWIVSLASRDTAANALWEVGFDNGSHPAPVVAGDTLFAASKVVEKRALSDRAGIVRFKLIGVKNVTPWALVESGTELFDSRFDGKVLEIERSVLLPR